MGGDRSDGGSDEDRAAILRRRAVFVASAVAGLGLATSCGDRGPAACLDISTPPDTSASAGTGAPLTAEPQPCLSPEPPPEPCLEIAFPQDAGVTTEDAGRDAGPRPQPCLRKAAPPDDQRNGETE